MITRRKFIQDTIVASTFVSTFPNIITSQKKEKLGVALVGLGYYSTDLLAPALQMTKHCHLAGIVTGSPDKVQDWQEKYNIKDSNVYHYDNLKDIANNSEIDVVYIVLPPFLHKEYAIMAANSGKHVWCEKPMALTADECQDIIDACNKNNVKLSIGYRMHHEPNTQRIMDFAITKPYGKIENIKAEAGYFDPRTDHWKQDWSKGGGAMYDMGVYALNAARYTTQEEPISVTATHSTKRPDIFKNADETTRFSLEFPSGAMAYCKTSLGENLNVLRVECENGWYGLEPFQSYSGIKGRTSDGIKFHATIPNQQVKQMDDDALAILRNTEVLVPGEEGMRDIKIIEAIFQSAKSHGKQILL